MLENLTDKSLAIIDDDEPFVRRLSKAMEKRGFIVSHALNISDGKKLVKNAISNNFRELILWS